MGNKQAAFTEDQLEDYQVFVLLPKNYMLSIIKCSRVNIYLEVAHSLALLLYFIFIVSGLYLL